MNEITLPECEHTRPTGTVTVTTLPPLRCVFCQLKEETEKRRRYELALELIARWPALWEADHAFVRDHDRRWLQQRVAEALVEVGAQVAIRVNGKQAVWYGDMRYADVVHLAGYNPSRILSVVYRQGPASTPEGILSPGESVAVVEGMVFNVADTSNA